MAEVGCGREVRTADVLGALIHAFHHNQSILWIISKTTIAKAAAQSKPVRQSSPSAPNVTTKRRATFGAWSKGRGATSAQPAIRLKPNAHGASLTPWCTRERATEGSRCAVWRSGSASRTEAAGVCPGRFSVSAGARAAAAAARRCGAAPEARACEAVARERASRRPTSTAGPGPAAGRRPAAPVSRTTPSGGVNTPKFLRGIAFTHPFGRIRADFEWRVVRRVDWLPDARRRLAAQLELHADSVWRPKMRAGRPGLASLAAIPAWHLRLTTPIAAQSCTVRTSHTIGATTTPSWSSGVRSAKCRWRSQASRNSKLS